MIKLIIFDLDDTLYNEIDFVKSGYNVIANKISIDYKLNKQEIINELNKLFIASSKNVFNRLLDKLNIQYHENYIKELINLYREHNPKIKLNNGTQKTLMYLRNKGYKLGIISDGNYITQKNKCNSLGLEKYIDNIELTDKYGKEYWKPNPYTFNKIINKYKVKPENIIYIGDNPKKDFYIKKYLNIRTVRIYNSKGIYYNEEYLNNMKEDYKINNIIELIDIIDKIK